MKTRAIEKIHDKDIGHKKFSWFVDTAIKDGHTITNIEEGYEKFKFKMDGYPMEFSKLPYAHKKAQLETCYRILEYHKKLEEYHNGQKQ